MLSELAVPFVDARASALSWWLGDDAPAALATLVLTSTRPRDEGRLELRLLGASHQVVASTGGVRCPEVVACTPTRSAATAAALPAQRDEDVDGARYRFRSTTNTYRPVALARVARDLRRRTTGAPNALVGLFPGSPDALTVLTGREVLGGWAWASWHVYPSAGEVVRTTSSLVTP